MISHEIQVLIDQVKALPNSQERNKIVSKLEDAMAWAIRMQTKVPPSLAATAPPTDNQTTASAPNLTCICPMPGVRNRSCTALVHK